MATVQAYFLPYRVAGINSKVPSGLKLPNGVHQDGVRRTMRKVTCLKAMCVLTAKGNGDELHRFRTKGQQEILLLTADSIISAHVATSVRLHQIQTHPLIRYCIRETQTPSLKHFTSCPDCLRPLLVSLNGHNSWLLSLPRPWADQKQSGRAYFHTVLEPWLVGPADLVASWFIHIDLPSAPAFPTSDAVEAVARQIEDLALEHVLSRRMSNQVFNPARPIDAILLSFHHHDHVHEATLRQFHGNVPVFATPQAARIVRPWNHFSTIAIIHDLKPAVPSWRASELHPGPPLPPWLTVLRLPGHRDMNFCTAIIWTHVEDGGVEVHESILTSPHGTMLDQGPLQAFLDSEPKTRKLAMLHGSKESHISGKQTSFGAKSGLALYRKLGGPKYWVLSHDLPLAYTGIFMRLSRATDIPRTLDWALDHEFPEKGLRGKRPDVFKVKNGGCLVLEP